MRSVLLSYLFVLVACFGLHAQAWDGTTATPFAGEGTSDDPYRIETPAQLAYLAKQVNAGETYAGKHFLQTANLDLGSKTWTPIGTTGIGTEKPFSGIYDGGNKTIANLVTDASANRQALFSYLKDGIIRNLGIISGHIQATRTAAALVYTMKGENSLVEYCYNKASVTTGLHAAGIAIGARTISSCYNAGTITCTNTQEGFALGISYTADRIINCYNTGTITAHGAEATIDGIGGSGEIITCYNASKIEATSTNAGNITSGAYAKVTSCYYDKELNSYAAFGSDKTTGTATGLSTQEMQSGEAWEGFDPEIWLFTEGAYPTLKAKESTVANEIVVKEEAYTVVAYGSQVTICLNEAAPQTFSLVDMAGRTISQQMVTDSYTFTAPGKGVYLIVPSQLNAGVKKIKL